VTRSQRHCDLNKKKKNGGKNPAVGILGKAAKRGTEGVRPLKESNGLGPVTERTNRSICLFKQRGRGKQTGGKGKETGHKRKAQGNSKKRTGEAYGSDAVNKRAYDLGLKDTGIRRCKDTTQPALLGKGR